jgi:hypothetical protein
MSADSLLFLDAEAAFPLPASFRYAEYLEIERELWALFPETAGKRANFLQMGLTAVLMVESEEAGTLRFDETYLLMPNEDGDLRPMRMKMIRRLSLSEFRLASYSSLKTTSLGWGGALQDARHTIYGEELSQEFESSRAC